MEFLCVIASGFAGPKEHPVAGHNNGHVLLFYILHTETQRTAARLHAEKPRLYRADCIACREGVSGKVEEARRQGQWLSE